MNCTILTIRTLGKKDHKKARAAAEFLDMYLQDFVVLCIKEKLKKMEESGYVLEKQSDEENE